MARSYKHCLPESPERYYTMLRLEEFAISRWSVSNWGWGGGWGVVVRCLKSKGKVLFVMMRHLHILNYFPLDINQTG